MLILHLLVCSALGAGPASPPAAEDWFATGPIPRIKIRVAPDQVGKLKAEPRAYAKATISEDGRDLPGQVALKLKGAAGSFREWDDKPAFTLNMAKFSKGSTFHGLVKFHLNNSAQDETYLNELLCSDLFPKAGVPAPRVTHARVWVNDRDLGLFVLKEGFDRAFLARSFADPTGNLYDGGFVQDLDAALEKDEGSGPDDRSDLKAIVEAASDPDPASRWRRLEALIDMDAFCSFMAMERMTCHWDGYVGMANNYRIYFDPGRGKAVFLPHGMDQMFSDPGGSLFGQSEKLVASPVNQSDAFRRRFRARLAELIPLMAPADGLLRRVDEVDRRVRPVIAAMDPELARRRDGAVASLKERLVARAASLREQIAAPEESLQEFDDKGVATLGGWWATQEAGEPIQEELETGGGKKALVIRAKEGVPCVASWRRQVLLGPGEYTLTASARPDGVIKPDGDDPGGVGVGRSGVGRDQHLVGSAELAVLGHRFRVLEDRRDFLLVLELRAKSGSVAFDLDSIKLTRSPPGK